MVAASAAMKGPATDGMRELVTQAPPLGMV